MCLDVQPDTHAELTQQQLKVMHPHMHDLQLGFRQFSWKSSAPALIHGYGAHSKTYHGLMKLMQSTSGQQSVHQHNQKPPEGVAVWSYNICLCSQIQKNWQTMLSMKAAHIQWMPFCFIKFRPYMAPGSRP